MAVHATSHGFTFHDRRSMSVEQAAAEVRLRPEPSPGQAFARKIHGGEPEGKIEKNRARREIFHLYCRYEGHLKLLTLPGLKWAFERGLLDHRRWNRPTTLVAAESDPAIYRAALLRMPQTTGLAQIDSGALVFSSDIVKWYECRRVEELIERTNMRFTGAWLDLTGPLTDGIIDALAALWPRVSDSMVVTFLGARYAERAKAKLEAAGGDWGGLLATLLGIPPERVSVYSYADPVPMVQVTAMKPSCVKRLAKLSPLPYDLNPVHGVLNNWPTRSFS